MNHSENSEKGWKEKVAEGQEAGGGCMTENSIQRVWLLSPFLPLGGAQHSRIITIIKKLVSGGTIYFIEGRWLTHVSASLPRVEKRWGRGGVKGGVSSQ